MYRSLRRIALFHDEMGDVESLWRLCEREGKCMRPRRKHSAHARDHSLSRSRLPLREFSYPTLVLIYVIQSL